VLHRDALRVRSTAVDLRRATAEDLPDIAVADGRAFGVHYTDTDLEDIRPLFDPDRFLLARHGGDGQILGVTGSFPFDVTLPGGGTLPAPGVTWVSVAVTHRRRGILRALMEEQHRSFAAEGLAVSLLTASEGGIYGRFGYGTATVHRSVEITRRRAAFRSGVPDPGGVRQIETPEARRRFPKIHRRWAALTPGAVSRSDAWWDGLMLDRESRRGGATALFHLVHNDGYASYRLDHSERACRVVDLAAATDEAYVALWHTLLAMDLTETIASRSRAVDEPLQHLLADPRQVRTTEIRDGMWARILDIPAALSARRYAAELDVVLDVRDPFLDLGGRFRLRGGPDGATCERVDAGGPAVALDVAQLGALLFGGERAEAFARAGLLEADDSATLLRLDAAFLAERAPQHGTEF
jgi:predicted acetyltransferase